MRILNIHISTVTHREGQEELATVVHKPFLRRRITTVYRRRQVDAATPGKWVEVSTGQEAPEIVQQRINKALLFMEQGTAWLSQRLGEIYDKADESLKRSMRDLS